jgi:hypothetical protein
MAVAVFTLIALLHLLRLLTGWEIVVTGYVVPVWFSLPGMIIAGVLAVMVWREARK